jgi:chromosome segregation ATPase
MIWFVWCVMLAQDFVPLQSEDLRIVERIRSIESRLDEQISLWPALETIRRELSESRKEREEIRGILSRFDLTALRDAIGELSSRSSDERSGILKAVLGGKESILEAIKPLGGILEEIRANRAEMAQVKNGLLSGLAEVRAEVIRAKAELTEAKSKLIEAQAELAAIQGSLGQRFFWFTIYLVGGCAVLLIGGTLVIGFVYAKLAKLINQIPFPKVV